MRIRSAGSTALTFLLLLTVLLAAGDELLCPDLLCCDDEVDPHELAAEAPDSGLQIVPAEEEHEDDCLCCGLRSQRVSLTPAKTTPTLEITEEAAALHGTFFVEPFPASHSSRGPPPIR